MMDTFPRGAQSFLKMDGTYNWTKPSGQLFFLDRARELGVEKIVAFSNSPHRRQSKNGLARASKAGIIGDGLYVLTNTASGRALDGGNANGNVLQWDKYENAAKQGWYMFHVEADRYRIANAYWQEQCLYASKTLLGALSVRPCSDTQDTTFSLVRSGRGFIIKLDGSDLYLSLQAGTQGGFDMGNGDHVRLDTLLPSWRDYDVLQTQEWELLSVSPGSFSPALPAVGKANLRPGADAAFAQYLVDCVSRLQQEHNITVDYVSPVNEPQYPWDTNSQEGSPWSQAEIVSVASALGGRLDIIGPHIIRLSTKVLVSESAQYKYAIDGNEPANLKAGLTGHPKVAAVFGAHAYYSNEQDYTMWKLRQDLLAKVRAAGQELWQTEYSMLEDPSKHESLKDVSPILDIHIAVHLAKVILNDLVFADAASWCFWTAMGPERGDLPTRFLLIRLRTPGGSDSQAAWQSGDGAGPAKTLWALGHFSRFVRPGYVRVWHSANWADGFGAVAFVNAAATELVEIYVNINKENTILDRASVTASVGGRSYVVSSRFYYTDASHDMIPAHMESTLSMGGFSILTVVSQLRYDGDAMG
jgi:O-glycosyl hydrolase